jgi:hypothetical protein
VRVQGLRGLAATMLIVGVTLIPLSPARAAGGLVLLAGLTLAVRRGRSA